MASSAVDVHTGGCVDRLLIQHWSFLFYLQRRGDRKRLSGRHVFVGVQVVFVAFVEARLLRREIKYLRNEHGARALL